MPVSLVYMLDRLELAEMRYADNLFDLNGIKRMYRRLGDRGGASREP